MTKPYENDGEDAPMVATCDQCKGPAYLCEQPDSTCRLKSLARAWLDDGHMGAYVDDLDGRLLNDDARKLAPLLRQVEDGAWSRLSETRTKAISQTEARVRELVAGLHEIRDFACERSFIMAMQSVVEVCDVLLTAKPSEPSDRPLDSVSEVQEKNNANSRDDVGAGTDDRDRVVHVRSPSEHALPAEPQESVRRVPMQGAPGGDPTAKRAEVDDVNGQRPSKVQGDDQWTDDHSVAQRWLAEHGGQGVAMGPLVEKLYDLITDVRCNERETLLKERLMHTAAGDLDNVQAKRPSYNHTRADGPFDPCPECLSLMSRTDLIELACDLQSTISDLREGDTDYPLSNAAVAAIDVLFTEYEEQTKMRDLGQATVFAEGKLRAAVEIREAVIRALRDPRSANPSSTKGEP